MMIKEDGEAGKRPAQEPLALLAVAALVVGVLLAVWRVPCGAQEVLPPPVEGLVARLEDEVRDLPAGRIGWTTYWQLCWAAYPGATAYELQTLTGEGSSRKLRRQGEPCLRLEAAKGENDRAQGLANRDMLLALQAGQLAYRVRAVLHDHRRSAWSPPLAVGEVTRR